MAVSQSFLGWLEGGGMLSLALLAKPALGKLGLEMDDLRKLVLGPFNAGSEVLNARRVNSSCWFKSVRVYYFFPNRFTSN